MSFQAVEWSRRQLVDSPSEKLVLMTLASYAGEFGECYPSMKTLTTETVQSINSVRRRIEELQNKGMIVKLERKRDNEAKTSNLYILLLDKTSIEFARKQGWNGVVDGNGSDAQHVVLPPSNLGGGGMLATSQIGGSHLPQLREEAPPTVVGGLEYTTNIQVNLPPTPAGGFGEDLSKFDDFKKVYPFSLTMSLPKAMEAFQALSNSERGDALRFASAYGRECQAANRKICDAAKYLREKRWIMLAERHVDPVVSSQGFGNQVWIEPDSPQAAAWSKYLKQQGKRLFMCSQKRLDGKQAFGCYQASAWPPPVSQQLDHLENGIAEKAGKAA